MKAKSISENLEFQRGQTPKKVLNLGQDLYFFIIYREDDTENEFGTAFGRSPAEAWEKYIINEWPDGRSQVKAYRKQYGSDATIMDLIIDIGLGQSNPVSGTQHFKIDLSKETFQF